MGHHPKLGVTDLPRGECLVDRSEGQEVTLEVDGTEGYKTPSSRAIPQLNVTQQKQHTKALGMSKSWASSSIFLIYSLFCNRNMYLCRDARGTIRAHHPGKATLTTSQLLRGRSSILLILWRPAIDLGHTHFKGSLTTKASWGTRGVGEGKEESGKERE